MDPKTALGAQLAAGIDFNADIVLYRLSRVADAATGNTEAAGPAGVLALTTMREGGHGLPMLLRGLHNGPGKSNNSCIGLDQQRLDDAAGLERPRASPHGRTRSDRMDEVFDGFARMAERKVIDADVTPWARLEDHHGQR